MRNISYVPHYAISSSRYSTREFKTGAEPFMVAMIIILLCAAPITYVMDNKNFKEFIQALCQQQNPY